MKSFESYRQLVILFWGPICIKNTFYVIACSIPFVLLLFWSVLFEKLDCKHLRGSHLLTFLWISGADLYVTSRWPDTSVFHSPIPALVPRPKFITPSWLWDNQEDNQKPDATFTASGFLKRMCGNVRQFTNWACVMGRVKTKKARNITTSPCFWRLNIHARLAWKWS